MISHLDVQENAVNQEEEHEDDDGGESETDSQSEDETDANTTSTSDEPEHPGYFVVCYNFVTTFFTSLIPQGPRPID